MNTQTVIGIIASICTAASLIPQLVKIVKEKEAENISFGMMIILFIGLGFWDYYGVLKNDIIIIVSNTFSLVINFLLTLFTWKYRSRNDYKRKNFNNA